MFHGREWTWRKCSRVLFGIWHVQLMEGFGQRKRECSLEGISIYLHEFPLHTRGCQLPVTICIGICVSEGIVLAGDSRSSYSNLRNWPRTASDSVQKVYQISDHVACAAYGWGMLDQRTIYSHMEDLKREVGDQGCYVDEAQEALKKKFQALYETHVEKGFDRPVPDGTAFGLVLAGYDNRGVGHLRTLEFPGGLEFYACTTLESGAVWRGQTDVVSRLIKGFDPRLDVSRMPEDALEALKGLEYLIPWMRMSLQDAVDFAIFLARATIGMQRFSDGILAQNPPASFPGVGGPIDVCLVRPSGFEWVQKKELHGEAPSWVGNLDE